MYGVYRVKCVGSSRCSVNSPSSERSSLKKSTINDETWTMKAATSKQLCTFYFTPRIPNDDGSSKNSEWECNKCSKTKLKSGGWTHLLNHARSCVGVLFQMDYEALHAKTTKPNSISSFALRIKDSERDMYMWVEWAVMLNQPLSIVDNPLTQEGMRYKPVTSKLLCKNILALGKEGARVVWVVYLAILFNCLILD